MGQLWSSLYAADGIAGQGDESTRIRKWLYGSLLVRDWVADGSTSLNGFTPFDTDYNIKTTLLSASNPGGRWFEVGSLSEDGVEFSPKFSTDETKIWQSRRSQRSDITEDDEEVMFTLMQSTPIVDALRNNQPLSWVTGQEVGQIGYNAVKPNATDTVYRQLMVIGVDGTIGNAEYCAELRPRVALAKVGKRTFNSKKVDSFEMTYNVFPDPVSGFSATTLRSGPSWVASGGAVVWPSPQTAPVVSGLAAGGKATITLQQPVSYNDPFTYTVKTSSDSGVTWTAATLDTTFPAAGGVGYSSTSAGVVTIKVTGVTAGAKLVQVFATGSNGSISPASSSSTSSTFLA